MIVLVPIFSIISEGECISRFKLSRSILIQQLKGPVSVGHHAGTHVPFEHAIQALGYLRQLAFRQRAFRIRERVETRNSEVVEIACRSRMLDDPLSKWTAYAIVDLQGPGKSVARYVRVGKN